jgi:hypothetical protein
MLNKVFHFFIIAVFLVVTLMSPYQAQACSCILPYVWREWEQSEAVFLGTVTDIQYMPPAPVMSSSDPITYTFDVHTVYKVGELSPFKVQSARETDSCGAGLEIGETYVVYAFPYQEQELLWTHSCTHPHPAATLSWYRYDILMVTRTLRGALGFKLRSMDTIHWAY